MPTSTAAPRPAHGTDTPTTGRLASLGWIAHWLLRIVLAFVIGIYGWSKIVLGQMGHADFGDALVQFGEMSPMGLLWRMVAYSPLFQFLAGLAEVGASLCLVWRRTAALGALIGAADMAFVFVLNLAYDVPVKLLSLALTVGCLLVLVPYVPRLFRAFLSFGPVPAARVAEPMPWPKARRVTRITGPLFGLAVAGAAAFIGTTMAPPAEPLNNDVAGTYRVASDTRTAPAQLAADDRWSQIALGARGDAGASIASVRTADGRLYLGRYRISAPGQLELTLGDALHGAAVSARPAPRTFTYTRSGDTLHLVGNGQDVTFRVDPEARFLYDRDFSWASRPPLNR